GCTHRAPAAGRVYTDTRRTKTRTKRPPGEGGGGGSPGRRSAAAAAGPRTRGGQAPGQTPDRHGREAGRRRQARVQPHHPQRCINSTAPARQTTPVPSAGTASPGRATVTFHLKVPLARNGLRTSLILPVQKTLSQVTPALPSRSVRLGSGA